MMQTRFFRLENVNRVVNSRLLPLGLILLGIFFRLGNYLSKQSIWLDEAWLARDIFVRSYKEIFLNIMTNNELPAIPPVGFLLIEKLSVQFFGNNEYTLRLFPFICSSLAVVFFWFLAKRVVTRLPALIALTFFVSSEMLINYSAECKQYGCEVLAAIILYLAAFYFQARSANVWRVIIFAVIGILAMAVSHTAILILGGIAIIQIVFFKNKNEFKKSWGYLFSFLVWGLCFFLIYMVYLNSMYKEDSRMGKFVINSTTAHFMPHPILSLKTVRWLWWSFSEFFTNVVKLNPAVVAIGLFVLGILSRYKKDPRKVFIMILPFILMIIAAGLKKFPFVGRFILFLLPITFLFVSEGLAVFMRKGKWLLGAGLIVYCIFLIPLSTNAVQKVIVPRTHEEMRSLIKILKERQLMGDKIYMNNSAQFAYMYYLQYFDFKVINPIRGYFDDEVSFNQSTFILYWFNTMTQMGELFSSADVRPLQFPITHATKPEYPQRTWLLLSHITLQDSEKFIKSCFDSRGKMLESYEQPGSWLYLYELYEPMATIDQAKKVFKLN